jgi:hypothetical protein
MEGGFKFQVQDLRKEKMFAGGKLNYLSGVSS